MVETWRDKLIFFGPGLLLAITAAGEFGIVEATETGAHFGMQLMWVVLIALLFKYMFTTGIARYTLATGKTIFEGLADLPGPRHWGQLLVVISYLVDILALGAMLQFAAVYLDYLLPGTFWYPGLCLIILLFILLVISLRLSHNFERTMAVLVVMLVVGMAVAILDFPIGMQQYTTGMSFGIPEGSEPSILAIIGVCGNGLNIMLYSYWLKQRIDRAGKEKTRHSFFKRYIRSVRKDLGIGFVIVFFVTIGFMALGYASHTVSLMPESAEFSFDALTTQVMYLMKSLPMGLYGFPVILMLIFIGAIAVGLSARVSIVATVIEDIRKGHGRKTNHDYLMVLLYAVYFVATMGVVFLGNPMETLLFSSSVSALLFGFFGFIMLYIDMSLPEYARGSRLWTLFLGFGSVLAIYVAFLIERSFLTYGMPLLESVVFGMVIVYVLTRLRMFKDAVSGRADVLTKIWIIGILGAVSIYGTIGGITYPVGDNLSLMINFRDLGTILAGIVAGPWGGFFAGLIGGGYRLTLGGVSAVPCFVSTVIAGVLTGLLMRRWKGELTLRRAAVLGPLFECMHLAIFFVYENVTGLMAFDDTVVSVITLLLPMTIANGVGVIIFWYFTRREKVFESSIQPFGFRELLTKVNGIIDHDEEHEDTMMDIEDTMMDMEEDDYDAEQR